MNFMEACEMLNAGRHVARKVWSEHPHYDFFCILTSGVEK